MGDLPMTTNETELLNLIRNHDNPTEALLLATAILISVIKPHEEVAAQEPAVLP